MLWLLLVGLLIDGHGEIRSAIRCEEKADTREGTSDMRKETSWTRDDESNTRQEIQEKEKKGEFHNF
jgi:hypothetical protein